MKIAERTATWRRERRVLLRAAWRLEQAEGERNWALASARAEGVSIALAAAVRLSSSRVHQIVPSPTSMSWTRRWVSCAPRAGPHPKTPARMTMPNWTGAT